MAWLLIGFFYQGGVVINRVFYQGGVVKIVWRKDSPVMYTASLDGNARVWDARTGSCVKVMRGHRDNILDMALIR